MKKLKRIEIKKRGRTGKIASQRFFVFFEVFGSDFLQLFFFVLSDASE